MAVLCAAGLALGGASGCKFLADEFYYVDRAPLERRGDAEARVVTRPLADATPDLPVSPTSLVR
jgi:hypothetical protein